MEREGSPTVCGAQRDGSTVGVRYPWPSLAYPSSSPICLCTIFHFHSCSNRVQTHRHDTNCRSRVLQRQSYQAFSAASTMHPTIMHHTQRFRVYHPNADGMHSLYIAARSYISTAFVRPAPLYHICNSSAIFAVAHRTNSLALLAFGFWCVRDALSVTRRVVRFWIARSTRLRRSQYV